MRKRAIHQGSTIVTDLELAEAGQPRRWLSLLGPVVYAIRTKDDLIKIGWTSDLHQRAIQLGGVDRLLGWMPGTLDDEQAIHSSLRGHAVRGREWYTADEPVLAVVNAMRADLGLGDIAA